MRYTLHDAAGNKIGEAETAQTIGNIAKHRTFSLDSNRDLAYPFTVYELQGGHIVGTMYQCETEAMDKLRTLK